MLFFDIIPLLKIPLQCFPGIERFNNQGPGSKSAHYEQRRRRLRRAHVMFNWTANYLECFPLEVMLWLLQWLPL
jgi:hypothetical protein